jgi:hypothetical protein
MRVVSPRGKGWLPTRPWKCFTNLFCFLTFPQAARYLHFAYMLFYFVSVFFLSHRASVCFFKHLSFYSIHRCIYHCCDLFLFSVLLVEKTLYVLVLVNSPVLVTCTLFLTELLSFLTMHFIWVVQLLHSEIGGGTWGSPSQIHPGTP